MKEDEIRQKERDRNKEKFKQQMLKDIEKVDRKYFKSEKVFSRVKSMDLKFKGKFTDHIRKAMRQKKYADKVRKRYVPSVSQEYQELTALNKEKAHFGLNLMKKRREIGIRNVDDSKNFLSHSTKLGRISLAKRKKGRILARA